MMEDPENQPPREPQPTAAEINAAIFRRLEGARAFRNQQFPERPALLRRQINNTDMATNFARSEYFVSPEDLPRLNESIVEVRDRVIARGKTIASHEDHVDLEDADTPSAQDANNSFWDRRAGYEANIDQFLPARSNVGTRLTLDHIDRETNVSESIQFDFANGFLYIRDYFDPQEPGGGLAYNSSSIYSALPLDRMTNEEFTLIMARLEHYIQVLKDSPDEDEL